MIKGLIRLAGVAMLGAAAMGLASCSPSEAPSASAGTEEAPAAETTSGSDALAGIGEGVDIGSAIDFPAEETVSVDEQGGRYDGVWTKTWKRTMKGQDSHSYPSIVATERVDMDAISRAIGDDGIRVYDMDVSLGLQVLTPARPHERPSGEMTRFLTNNAHGTKVDYSMYTGARHDVDVQMTLTAAFHANRGGIAPGLYVRVEDTAFEVPASKPLTLQSVLPHLSVTLDGSAEEGAKKANLDWLSLVVDQTEVGAEGYSNGSFVFPLREGEPLSCEISARQADGTWSQAKRFTVTPTR